jgi:hypothetical protein
VDIDREPDGVAMAFVVLTRRNLAALKTSLLAAFPDLGSGHADEAIAAGLGYRTHAALLASLKAQGNARVTVVLSEKVLSDRLRELAGLESEGTAWMRVLIQENRLPDPSNVFNVRDWVKDVANQN